MQKIVNGRRQQAQLNQHSKFHHDSMVLYQLKLVDLYIEEQMAYFITDNNTTKRRDPNINITKGIHKIKGRTSVNILVSNNTNKHLPFNKGEYIGYLEPAITNDTTIDLTEAHQTNSITLQKMMAEQVKPDVFDPPCHKLTTNVQNELETLLKKYELQFAKDEIIYWNHTPHQHDD